MIVAVLPGGTADDVRRDLAALAARPGFRRGAVAAEIRLDFMTPPDVSVFAHAPIETIATCRRPRDGGRYRGTEDERFELLRKAAEAGATWVDTELECRHSVTTPPHVRRIVSLHDFEAVPSDLPGLVRQLLAPEIAMVKIAARARTLLDLVALSGVTRIEAGRVTAIGLGSVGIPSRWLFDRFGSPWIFAAYAPPGGKAAPELLAANVPTLEDLVDLYRGGPDVPPPVATFGVLGDQAASSLGPLVFNRVFRGLGLPATYIPLTTPTLVGLREVIRILGIRGLSVTTPFKEAILPFAEAIHPRVRSAGAANTLVFENGKWTAYNTDVDGVTVPVRKRLHAGGRDPSKMKALVVGVGGAGRAAAIGLRSVGMDVAFFGRTPAKAEAAAQLVGVPAVARPVVGGRAFDLVLNATPAGSLRDPSGRAVDISWVKPDGIVFETNYRPRETPLMREAAAAGLTVIGGDEMYLAQAAAQLHFFWGGLAEVENRLTGALSWAYQRIASP